MKTPEGKQIAFTFGSHPMKDPKQRWKATVVFPPGSGGATSLPVTLTDGEGTPVDEAVFEFAGRRIAIVNGSGSITYADFVAGHHETALWVHRRGIAPVPGGLTFE